MKEALFTVLNTICPNNVYLQGTIDEDRAYPDSFITYFTNDTDDRAFYSNEVTSFDWTFSVIYYSNDPALVNTVPATITAALKNAGFIPQGKGRDIPSDEPTHTGWAMEFIITEYVAQNT